MTQLQGGRDFRRTDRRRGQAVALVLAMLAVLGGLLAVRSILGESDLRRARHAIHHNQATYAAEGGLQLALMARERPNAPDSWAFRVGDHDVLVVEHAADPYLCELRATVRIGDVTVTRSLYLQPPIHHGGHP
ncbi:MAG: hypothetical protein HY816_02015 [Candidatus Wallbacteria bacterium]|nr:hypothetical protein [Candidatus Wallbacteria bacterium]